jgi:DNA polymerase-1
VVTKNGIPTKEQLNAYRNGEPVFCLKPLIKNVQNEISALAKMNIVNSHIVMVFDPLGKNFRHRLFPDYKGNRDAKAPERRRQEELMYDMFVAMGYPCLRIDDYEADDTINTLSIKLSNLGIKNYIMTGDKDIMSRCDENTFIYSGRVKKLYGVKEVSLKFNLPPSKVLDYLALKGDAVDGLAGAKGIGEKSATIMLQHFSLDEILAEPDIIADLDIRGVKGMIEGLKKNKDDVVLMRQLTELKSDVPLGINNLKQLACTQGDPASFLGGFLLS